MSIDWNGFTPILGLAGGVLIGIAAVMLILFNGRVAGIAGIVGGLLRPRRGDITWRLAFIGGVVLAPLGYLLFAPLPVIHIETSDTVLAVAGLLVGVGTRYGSGCTSGHGVCGLSRFSPRSLVATLLFMAVGFVTVYGVRHVFFQ